MTDIRFRHDEWLYRWDAETQTLYFREADLSVNPNGYEYVSGYTDAIRSLTDGQGNATLDAATQRLIAAYTNAREIDG